MKSLIIRSLMCRRELLERLDKTVSFKCVKYGVSGLHHPDSSLEQVHSQTIDILVSEKSELLTRLAATEAQLEASQSKHCVADVVST